MKEPNPLSDQNQTPEDVATLYSWANLHGAKYRDFSASRAQTRETARLRAEQTLEEEHRRNQNEAQAEAAQAAATRLAAEEAQAAEQARQELLAAEQAQLAAEQAERAAQQAAELAAQREAQLAAQRAVEEAAEQAARMESEQAARRAEEEAAALAAQQAAEQAAQLAARQAAERAAEQAAKEAAERAAEAAAEQAAQQRASQPPRLDRFPLSPSAAPAAPSYPQPPQSVDSPGYLRSQPYRPAPPPLPFTPPREESTSPRGPWATPDLKEPAARPAWLVGDNVETPSSSVPPSASVAPAPVPPVSAPPAPDNTLQGSRDRLASRWFALRGVFDGTPAAPEPVPAPVIARAPAMAVFSLAGGVGKTSIVATLGRALSARGERVLLVDTAAFGLLPFFFGATDQRPGLLRTFNPPGVSSDAPVQMVTIDPEGLSNDASGQDALTNEILKLARGASRILVDLATASGATIRRVMRMSPLVLVPVVPDMNSVVSVSSIDAFFEHNSNSAGKLALPFYVLNQFDPSLPLHLDVREVLREELADRLLPFALRSTPAMSEALAEGMTVIDYAPGSALAEDFVTLAAWVKSLAAPAITSYRGVRWSER